MNDAPVPLDRGALAETIKMALRRFGAHTPTLFAFEPDLFKEDAEAVLGVVWPMLRALEIQRDRCRQWNGQLARAVFPRRQRRKRRPIGRVG